jgi:transaldolase
MTGTLGALSEAGVSIWLPAGHDHVVGVITSPSIFARATAHGPQIGDLCARGVGLGEAMHARITFDVRWACDMLRPVYEASGGTDGRVPIEADSRLAHDTEATIAEARALWWQVDRPNLFIKIPAARQGLPAIAACLAEKISINVTLIFSVPRYEAVTEAFLEGMERARQANLDLSSVRSVACLFVSRVGTEAESGWTRWEPAGRRRCAGAPPSPVRGRPTRLTGGCSPRSGGPRCKRRGPARSGPLWASASVKEPAYPDTRCVTWPGRPGVVNTMPEATLGAVADHGRGPAGSIRWHYDEAQQVIDTLQDIGIDFDAVTNSTAPGIS